MKKRSIQQSKDASILLSSQQTKVIKGGNSSLGGTITITAEANEDSR
ncbi:MAG: hypothetical protein AAFV95_14235 [Bacteroidota bacterium]